MIPASNNIIIGIDFGQGNDITEKIVFKRHENMFKVLSVETIGRKFEEELINELKHYGH